MRAEVKRAISNATLEANLDGKLLLVHGALDGNAQPCLTARLADTLVKADKDFDLIMIPGADHVLIERHHYFMRTWEYFARHLRGSEPPRYRFSPLQLPNLGG